MPTYVAPVVAAIIVVIAAVVTCLKVIPEYERGVLFTLGKLRPLH